MQFMTNNIMAAGWRDISIFNPSLDNILKALGTSYNESLLKLTTYPYWLRFHSEENYSSDIFKVHAAPVPKILLSRRKKTASRFSYLRSSVIRMCPECLTEDLERHGEPYLHRAHHLPFINICHKHQIELISKCRNCGIIFLADETFINAKLKCACNADLRQFRSQKTEHTESWINLAKYSADALMSDANISACTNYFKFFDSQLNQFKTKDRNGLLELLAKSFGINSARALLTLSPQKSDDCEFSAIGSVTRNELRAPQFCAFFAANNFSFEVSNSLFKQYLENKKNIHVSNTISDKFTANRTPGTVDEARNYVHQLENTFPDKPIRSYIYVRYKSLFWYLTLFDKQWFESKYPNGGRGATKHIPTIQEDRETILSAIKRASRPRITIWKNLSQQAFFRASLRDAAWLEIRKHETISEARNIIEKKKIGNLEFVEQELKNAYEVYIRSSIKHIRITITSLAPYTTYSQLQLRYLVSKNSNLKKYISETKAEFDLRMLNLI